MKTASVLITGSSGYVGTATKEVLEQNGYMVIGFDKKDGNDTRNIFKLFFACLKKPKAIIHLSAKKSIPKSIESPMSYYLNNILSSFSVGIVSRVLGIPVVFSSSAAVYNPTNPYAKSKLIEEQLLKCLSKGLVVLRYFNLVGKTKTVKDDESTNIFSIIGREPHIKINNVSSTRDYVHVMDIALANVLSVEYLNKNKEEIAEFLKARVDEKEAQIAKLNQENATLKEQMTNQTILKNNSSLKGANFEEEFTEHITSRRKWILEDTSKEPLSFDRQSTIYTVDVAFELKGHDSKKNVPQEDVNTFVKSMQLHTTKKVGFFIASKKAIANKSKSQFTFEITKEDQLCVYINKFSEIDENTAVDMIDAIIQMWKNVLDKLPKTESVDCKTKNIALLTSMNEAMKSFTNSIKLLDDYYKSQRSQLTEGLNTLLTSIKINSE